MLSTASQQMVLDQLVKRDNIPEDPLSSSTSTFKGSKKPKDAPINQGLGKLLGRPKAHAKFNKEPSECNHRSDALRCRANSKATWWTCADCGSRWQRPREDPSTTASSNFQVDEQAKKVKNAQGQEFPKFLPAPRGRLNQGYRQVELDVRGKPKTLVQTHQQPPPITPEASSTPPATRANLRTAAPAPVDTSPGGEPSSPKATSRVRTTSSGLRPVQRAKTPTRRSVSVNSATSVETWEINADEETVDAEMPHAKAEE